jgi:DNA-binding XRE family transcriptional regulator
MYRWPLRRSALSGDPATGAVPFGLLLGLGLVGWLHKRERIADAFHPPHRNKSYIISIFRFFGTRIMSPEQCRAARGWLGWSQQRLAIAAEVPRSIVTEFEKGRRTPIGSTLIALREALETEGIIFIPNGITFSGQKGSANRLRPGR